MDPSVIWRPKGDELQSCRLTAFKRFVEEQTGQTINTYDELHHWSVEQNQNFWSLLLKFFKPIGSGSGDSHGSPFLDYQWFPHFRLNFAENLLRAANCPKLRDQVALRFRHESGLGSQLTYHELYSEVARVQKGLSQWVGEGDVVAAYLPNLPETVIAMLATSSLGAIFTSTSCDFGVSGVVDRFQQTEPSILVTCTRYQYNGKEIDLTERIREIQALLPSVKQIILLDFLSQEEPELWEGCTRWSSFPPTSQAPTFVRQAFSAPLAILYSSGTTGKPKCIVHGVGGTLINHLKELALHTDVGEGSKITFFTTCGWMMWNWVVSSLACGAELLLYEGSPSFPSSCYFLDVVAEEKVEIVGTSPKYLRHLESLNTPLPRLDAVSKVLSTGAPLLPEQFDFVCQDLAPGAQVISLSGGTDILGCFFLGNPWLPVFRGELQCVALGMDVVAFDESGAEVWDHEGELVCRSPFPHMPICFWKDPDRHLYRAAYFNTYPDCWHHGDFIFMRKGGGIRILGRSDTTLNPGGVRIGTAEIYRQVERLPFVADSVCVGKEENGEVQIILFVKPSNALPLSEDHVDHIRREIRKQLSPRHVPHEVRSVPDIPYTASGKKLEVLVSKLVNGKDGGKALGTVVNAECLTAFQTPARPQEPGF